MEACWSNHAETTHILRWKSWLKYGLDGILVGGWPRYSLPGTSQTQREVHRWDKWCQQRKGKWVVERLDLDGHSFSKRRGSPLTSTSRAFPVLGPRARSEVWGFFGGGDWRAALMLLADANYVIKPDAVAPFSHVLKTRLCGCSPSSNLFGNLARCLFKRDGTGAL